jgi:hypothetical protein
MWLFTHITVVRRVFFDGMWRSYDKELFSFLPLFFLSS